MTMAVTASLAQWSAGRAVRVTGNTSASAAAYAARAGITCAVLVPQGKIAMGKLGAGGHVRRQDPSDRRRLRQTAWRRGAQDDRRFPGHRLVVNSVNPTGSGPGRARPWRSSTLCGGAPDVHRTAVGNAGNITANWEGYREYPATVMRIAPWPRMLGFPGGRRCAAGAGAPVRQPETIATAIRIGSPASWSQAVEARRSPRHVPGCLTDDEILAAYHLIARSEGVFVEPASAASVARSAQVDRGRLGQAWLDGGLHSYRRAV